MPVFSTVCDEFCQRFHNIAIQHVACDDWAMVSVGLHICATLLCHYRLRVRVSNRLCRSDSHSIQLVETVLVVLALMHVNTMMVMKWIFVTAYCPVE